MHFGHIAVSRLTVKKSNTKSSSNDSMQLKIHFFHLLPKPKPHSFLPPDTVG